MGKSFKVLRPPVVKWDYRGGMEARLVPATWCVTGWIPRATLRELRPTNRTRDDEITCPNYTSCNTLSLRLPPFLSLTSVIRNQRRSRPSDASLRLVQRVFLPDSPRERARLGISSAPASSFAVDASSVIYAARMFALVANSHVLPLTCCAHRGTARPRATTGSLALFVFQTIRGVGRAIDSKREPTAPTCFVT